MPTYYSLNKLRQFIPVLDRNDFVANGTFYRAFIAPDGEYAFLRLDAMPSEAEFDAKLALVEMINRSIAVDAMTGRIVKKSNN
jgi:hypothetical protein